ncbi:MAG: peptidoglycan bridge formation glycyltransferase FemA/FemB family protein [Anaerolineae bacterium]|nr:peptidoglycan bridge formation glycyltransferase FemA/FemB family protein [Anaerolineae bacterium]
MHVDDRITPHEWDRFVASHPDGHVLQTSAWGAHKSCFGWQSERIAIRHQNDVIAGAQVLFRRLPLGWTLAYVPKGPLVDLGDASARQVFEALHERCHARRAILLTIEPDQVASPGLSTQLAGYGFVAGKRPIQPSSSLLIDLDGTEDDLLQRMKSKTRYNIRLAERKGVRVRQGSRQDVVVFNRLMDTTGERDAFDIRSPEYYERAYKLFVPLDMARLFIATYQDQPIAGLMAFACGPKAWYLFGASGNEHREKMPNYALQWAAIRWARARGCHTYDLWGVPDESEGTLEAQFSERSDGLWGVYRFKRGFGGRLVRYAGAFDYVYSRPLYALYALALRLQQ